MVNVTYILHLEKGDYVNRNQKIALLMLIHGFSGFVILWLLHNHLSYVISSVYSALWTTPIALSIIVLELYKKEKAFDERDGVRPII